MTKWKFRYCVFLCLLFVETGHTFDTAEDTQDPKIPWHAAYLGPGNVPGAARIHNEHTYLSDIALRRIGAAEWLGIGGVSTVTAVDLNSSVFKRHDPDLFLQNAFGDDGKTLLEERLIPTPSHFTGMPDYSYTVYDWANKTTICPVKITSNPELCHVFRGWMGAMNANHFGSQTTITYQHYHEIALTQARKANAARDYVVTSMGLAAIPHYRQYLRELEAEAFVFEAVAQHYLQDRWSTGHMWERWNGSDMENAHSIYWVNFLIGMTAGLIHGSEAVVSPGLEFFSADQVGLDTVALDMLSSPQIVSPSKFDPAWWKFGSGDGALYPGVGDKRVLDLMTNRYNGNLLKAENQKLQMLSCFSASWAAVIRAVGKHPQGAGYGMDNIFLNEYSPTFDPSEKGHRCTDAWVTNDSIYRAWLDDLIIKLLRAAGFDIGDSRGDKLVEIARLSPLAGLGLSEQEVNDFIRRARWEFTGLSAFLETQRRRDKWLRKTAPDTVDSISLARGGIRSFAGRSSGDDYASVASWVEPVALDSLPVRDEKGGRDKQSLFGLFSRAHIDNWCNNPEEIFDYARSSDGQQSKQDLAACTFIADMMYQGTTEGYDGLSQENRTIDGKIDSLPVESFCKVNSQADFNSQPIRLSPGYVSFEPDRPSSGPYEQTNKTYRSVYNWCRKTPILDLLGDSDEPDLVGKATTGESVRLSGEDFGSAAGHIRLVGYTAGANRTTFDMSAQKWSDNFIDIAIPDSLPAGKYCARVVRADDVQSEGRFVLSVDGVAKEEKADLELSVGSSATVTAEYYGHSATLEIVLSDALNCPAG